MIEKKNIGSKKLSLESGQSSLLLTHHLETNKIKEKMYVQEINGDKPKKIRVL